MTAVSNPSSSLTFTELLSSAHQVTNDATWEDWDISSLVPASVVWVIIMVDKAETSQAGVRTNGSALNRYMGAAVSTLQSWTVAPDASRVIEIYNNYGAVKDDFYVVGYVS